MRVAVRSIGQNSGYALVITLLFLVIMLTMLASVTRLTYVQSTLTARNNIYNSSVAAAEAGTEVAIAQMQRDFLHQSINSDLEVYRRLTPAQYQDSWPLHFQFSDDKHVVGQTGVESLGPAVVTNLDSQFSGLYGLVLPYRITSTATPIGRLYEPPATVRQDIQLASIPVFQFAIFYTLDLEISPGPLMNITGKVHSNGDIYTAPVSGLVYQDDVTAVGHIYNSRMENDPQWKSPQVKPDYRAEHADQVSSLSLPVGDNDPNSVRKILEPPDPGENANSEIGKQRYYNKADLIITTTQTGVKITTGAWNFFGTVNPNTTNSTGPGFSFVKTDPSFFDLRENRWTTTTQIDVQALKEWLHDPKQGAGINSLAEALEGHGVNSIYVNDQRLDPNRLTAVRVVNGANLPEDGLTVATPLPIYVKGDFNLNNGDTTPGLTDTSKTKPASLVGDCITILSDNWDDGNAGKTLKFRSAQDTTVNAALLGGIVKTTKVGNTKYYSGGAENFPRFLEDWDGDTLTYNGSMVVMFESQLGKKFWQSPGNYYNAPTRKWAFDLNFLNQEKLPPGTPQVRKLIRQKWVIVPTGT
jgi:hypothetical protein